MRETYEEILRIEELAQRLHAADYAEGVRTKPWEREHAHERARYRAAAVAVEKIRALPEGRRQAPIPPRLECEPYGLSLTITLGVILTLGAIFWTVVGFLVVRAF